MFASTLFGFFIYFHFLSFHYTGHIFRKKIKGSTGVCIYKVFKAHIDFLKIPVEFFIHIFHLFLSPPPKKRNTHKFSSTKLSRRNNLVNKYSRKVFSKLKILHLLRHRQAYKIIIFLVELQFRISRIKILYPFTLHM